MDRLPSEIAAIAQLTTAELVGRYGRGPELLDRILIGVEADWIDVRFEPAEGVGLWSVREALGHIADAELVYAHRLRRAVAEPEPTLPGWDQDAFVTAGLYRADGRGQPDPAATVALVRAVRRWVEPWLATLPDSAWSRRCLHPRLGEHTVGEMTARAVWHLEHHARFVAAKIERLRHRRADGAAGA